MNMTTLVLFTLHVADSGDSKQLRNMQQRMYVCTGCCNSYTYILILLYSKIVLQGNIFAKVIGSNENFRG